MLVATEQARMGRLSTSTGGVWVDFRLRLLKWGHSSVGRAPELARQSQPAKFRFPDHEMERPEQRLSAFTAFGSRAFPGPNPNFPAAPNSAAKGMVAVTETYCPAVPPVDVAEGQTVELVTFVPFTTVTTPLEVAQP